MQDKTEKEAVPVVSHTGAKETPSAGSDPGCEFLFHSMSPAIFPGGQGPHQGQVQEAVWDIYRSISNLKRAAACGDDQQRVKASRALRSLQKLLGRSGRKMRKLERERLKAQEQKKAEKEHQDKRAFRLKQEKRRMRSARLGSDACLVKEGMEMTFIFRRTGGFQEPLINGSTRCQRVPCSLFDAVPSGAVGWPARRRPDYGSRCDCLGRHP